MERLDDKIRSLSADVKKAAKDLNFDELEAKRRSLRREMQSADFWKDTRRAQAVSKEEASISRRIEPWLAINKELSELEELTKLNDDTIAGELERQLDSLEEKLAKQKKELRFSGPYDDHDVILSIYAGAGGTDAQDWAQMLLRMYTRWAETGKLKVHTVEQSAGEEAGIKSVTLEISGSSNLYGKLKAEQGVHRLVRLSPFNADNLRQTSFARVDVLPAIERPDEVEIDDNDIKVDVFRAGGHGGQSVNTTDSAVRVTHLPTGITVAIQNERSQLQNKETAMTILRSRLASLQLEQHAKTLKDIKGPNQSAEWGNQVRNYVLHPYKQVKDLRSGYESSDVEKVLDGELDPLIESAR